MKLALDSRTAMGRAARFAAYAVLAYLASPFAMSFAATITYVQNNYAAPQSSPTSVAVKFNAAQKAGDLNVAVVGWNNNTTTVSSVTDSSGNIYARAVGPTIVSGALSQSIYYARNILAAAAGANTVTVQFSTAAAFPDIRILEYSGADLVSPVDVTVAATGSGGTSNSGSATTTNPTDLIFGANMVTGLTSGPGTGFTQRVLTSPDSDIAEDRAVTTTGSYSATAPASGSWIMQMVAFRTPVSGVDTQPPTAPSGLTATAASGSQINLGWTASTDNVGVVQYLVERCQGAGCTTFAQIGTSSGTTYNDTGLTANTSYSYRARATDAAGNLGAYSTVATVITLSPDTQPPTAPSNLTATAAASGTQINLGWTASTDNVAVTQYLIERCQGAGCTTFAQIGTSTGTTYNDTGLTVGTSYSYRARATDAAGNLGAYSNVASTTIPTPDTQPPTAPSNLTATPASGTQINLSWAASTDNVAVTGYRVERCQGLNCSTFTQIATTTTTTYPDASVSTGSYSYRVRAADAAGNLSTYSNIATGVIPDTQPPTAPSALTAVASGNQIGLSWTASTDNVGVTGYLLERCQGAGCTTFAQIASPTATTYNDLGLTTGTSYSYRVRAGDAANNLSPYSNVASASTFTVTTITFVQSISADPQSSPTSVAVKFNAAQKAGDLNVAVVGWNNSTTTVSSVTDSSGNTYQRAVGPTIVSGNLSQSIYYARNILAAAAGANTVTVQFSTGAAFPDIRILEYSGADLASPVDVTAAATGSGGTPNSGSATTTNPTDLIFGANMVTGLTSGPGTGFTQRVLTSPDSDIAEDRAVTAAGSYSATAPASGSWIMQMVAFRTPISGPDTQPPTAPSNLTATAASGSQINLGWTASTDNVGVTQYLVERCQGAGCTTFAQIGTSIVTSYNDTGLTANTSYSYRARATDAAGNLGPYSSVASTTTQAPDTQPPTAPSNLTATAASGSQINLSWTGSTDNVGVTGYLIERCQGVGCASFARLLTVPGTTYSDTGLVPNTSYTYQVKATDAAGNFSPYSGTATANTLATIAGLVAAYSFDEGSGTTVADLSGNGNTGTLSNTTWTGVAKYGNALVFNGSSSRVTINDAASLRLSTGVTLEAWVNPSTVSTAWRDIVYKGNDNYFLESTTNTGAPGAGVTIGSVDAVTRGTTPLTVNSWSHLALTYDGSTLRLYVNGVQVSSLSQPGAIAASTNPLQIGGDSTFAQFFTGTIDEVRVYNTALNQSQIQTDMATPLGSGGSLPLVSLSSPTINFGSVSTGSTSPAQPVTVTNIGGVTLAISAIAVSGSNAGDFAQTNNCVPTLAPGISCTINITFTPTTTGPRSSAVTIADNAPGTPQTIALSGTGIGFAVTPRQTALTSSQTQSFTATSGPVTWSVDRVAGGSVSSGTITSAGLYTAPSGAGTHTVTATTTDLSQSASATVYITNYPGTFTHHNDNLRTGQNINEKVLTPAIVNQAQFGKLFSYTLDGIAFASPLYVANVNIPGKGFHNVVYIATEHDSVYAWDADGLSATALWKVSFLKSGVTTVPCGDTGECGDIPNEIGITGTPVIDPASGTLYVAAKTKEGTSYVQRLHALDITTGAEKFGGPVVIQASVPGSGQGSSGGQMPFNNLRENQRPALLLVNGNVYMGWASHGDQLPWHGWIIGYNATTLQQVAAFCVSPDNYGGGVWSSGGGLGSDSSGNIYFTTGNGDFTVNTGGKDYGDSVVKLGPTGTVVDYFTPFDQANMESQNFDLSSAGPVLLLDQPGTFPHLLIAAAKSGTIYVVNRDNMGHFHAGSDSQIPQSLPGILPNGLAEEGNYSAPAFFNGYVYFAAVNDTLKAFQLTNGLLSVGPTSQSLDVYPNRGGSFAVSGNGNTNGIVWAMQDNNPGNGILRAYDASNLANELYDSSQAGSRDTFGVASKFSIPLVANGKVFVGAQNQFVGFGLLP
jgi:chitodextrinase